MNRREFLCRTSMTAAGLAVSSRVTVRAQGDAPRWRVFAITTQVRVLRPRGATRVWLPTPLAVAPYQKTMGDTYHPGDGTAVMIETNANEPDILGCSWDEGIDPALTLVSRVAVTEYDATLRTPRSGADVDKARAIFDATAATAAPDRGPQEEIHARFVSACRAAGIPARTVYGLGLSSEDATKAQRCRAEIALAGLGWFPVDLAAARPAFGSWDPNWIAYNFAQNVSLRGSTQPRLGSFMYPHGETAEGPLDSLDPEHFTYSITVHETE